MDRKFCRLFWLILYIVINFSLELIIADLNVRDKLNDNGLQLPHRFLSFFYRFFYRFFLEQPRWPFGWCNNRVFSIDFNFKKFRKTSVGEKNAKHMPRSPYRSVHCYYRNQHNGIATLSTNGMEFQLHQLVRRFYCQFGCWK